MRPIQSPSTIVAPSQAAPSTPPSAKAFVPRRSVSAAKAAAPSAKPPSGARSLRTPKPRATPASTGPGPARRSHRWSPAESARSHSPKGRDASATAGARGPAASGPTSSGRKGASPTAATSPAASAEGPAASAPRRRRTHVRTPSQAARKSAAREATAVQRAEATAAPASRMPAPKRAWSPLGRADAASADVTASGRVSPSPTSSAAAPATWGAAMLVPLKTPSCSHLFLPASHTVCWTTATPGAAIASWGPREENHARPSFRSVALTATTPG